MNYHSETKRVYHTDIHSVDELKQRLVESWCNPVQITRLLTNCVKGIKHNVRAKAGHLEHIM